MDTWHGAVWFLAAGGLLVAMALASSVLKRLPLSGAMFYLAFGYALGPTAGNLLTPHPVADAHILERITEVAVIVSLFSAGLKLRRPLTDRLWWPPVRLATVSMLVTVGLVAAAGVWGLGLPVGAAILLGAVLAPTDPVLAADVQVTNPSDRDRLRFSLTGEAGLNDGTAFPFVMLGLGLLGWHEVGQWGWRWFAADLVWAVAGGLLIGAALGHLVGRLVIYLREAHREAVGLDDFLCLGLIGLAYGAAVLAHAYGFLAVFAAGLAVRRVEMQFGRTPPPEDVVAAARAGTDVAAATHPTTAPAYMAEAVLGFNERIERVCEVAVVVVLGALLATVELRPGVWWFVPLLLVVIRPAAALAGLFGTRISRAQLALIGWFGIRGVGSLYYIMFALTHGLEAELGKQLTDITLVTVAVSVVLHGVSVTPLMDLYSHKAWRRFVKTWSRTNQPS